MNSERSICFCFWSACNKGACHHAWLRTIFNSWAWESFNLHHISLQIASLVYFLSLLLKLSLFCHCLNFSLAMHIFIQFFLLCCTLAIFLKSFTVSVTILSRSLSAILSVVHLLSWSIYICFLSFAWHLMLFFVFFLRFFNLTCRVFYLQMCLCITQMQYPRKSEDYIRCPGTECWQSDQDPLKKQHVLSSSEPWISYGFSVSYILNKFTSIMLGAILEFPSFGPHLGVTSSSTTSADS